MSEQISDAGNTLIPAFLVLESKGYRVWWERKESNDVDEHWYAEGPDGRFCAQDSVALLGLVTMREIRGPSWKPSDIEVDEFMKKYDT